MVVVAFSSVLSFSNQKPHILHFAAGRDIILWQGVSLESHMIVSMQAGLEQI